jgi:hypothetical protein
VLVAIEAYRIAVSLLLDSNIPGMLPGMLRNMEALDKSIQGARDSARGLAGALRLVNKEGAGIAKMAASLDGMAAAAGRANAGVAGMGRGAAAAAASMAAAASSAERAARSSSTAGRLLAAPREQLRIGGPPGGGGRGAGGDGGGPFLALPGPDEPFNENGPYPIRLNPRGNKDLTRRTYMAAALTAGMIGYGAFEVIRVPFDAAAKIKAQEAGLLKQGFTPEQVSAAQAQAFETQRGIPGTTALGNLGLTSKIMAMTQDAAAAMRLMPEFSKLGVVLDTTGHTGEGAGMMAAIRAGEYRGVLSDYDPTTGKQKINYSRLTEFIHGIESASILSHGQIGPAQMYQMLKSGGISAAMLEDKSFFARMIASQIAMGSQRAGTGLQSFGMQFSAGKMSIAGFHLLQEMGVYSKDPTTWRKAGIGQVLVLPHGMPTGIQNMERDNPQKFILEFLLPKIQAWLKKNYGGDYTGAAYKRQIQMEAAAMQTITSRIPGGTFGVDVIRNQLLIARDVRAYQAGLGRDAFGIEQANNPELAVKGFTASWEALMAVLGDPNMGASTTALKDITTSLNGLSAFLSTDAGKVFGRVLFDVAAGFSLFAVGKLAYLGMKVLGGSEFAAVARTFGLFAPGAPAEAGLIGAGTALAKLASIASGLGPLLLYNALPAPPNPMKGTNYQGALHAVNPFASGLGFNIWDRNTWANPNSNPITAVPKSSTPPSDVHKESYTAPADGTMHVQNIAAVYLDGHAVGQMIFKRAGDHATLPPSSGTGFDPSATPTFTAHLMGNA